MFTPAGIVQAYTVGAFPMAAQSGTIEWYMPDPRAVMPLNAFHVSRTLTKVLQRGTFTIYLNRDFEAVMRACADREEGSWIDEQFVRVYGELYRTGWAHSVETWRRGRLVGGVYGVAIGGAFFAESMFHRETNASKVALAVLVNRLRERGYTLMDVQFLTDHLRSLGAIEIPHQEYIKQLAKCIRTRREFV